MSRVTERKEFAEDVRITLLEGDADKSDEGLASVANEIRSLRNAVVGLLIGIATGAVLVAVDIVVQTGG